MEPKKEAEKDEATLPTVNVKDTRDREAKGYQGGTTSVGKLPQLPRDIPASTTIVTEQLIHDRNADTLREALRNVPGLTFNAGEGGRIGDNITLRGFSVVGDLYLDNIRDIAQYNRETYNLEQIDVMRGSASMLFGRGSTGGVINQVSKQPFLANRSWAGLTVGSFDYVRAVADLNYIVAENAAVRLNAMYTQGDSFRNAVSGDKGGVAPSVRWGIGTPDEFALNYYYLRYSIMPDYGVPYFQGKPIDVPVERFYGLANADHQDDSTSISTATWIHRFASDTQLRTALRYADYDRDLWAVAPRLAAGTTVITDATVLNRQRQARGGHEETLTLQNDFTTMARAWGVQHQLLAGVELLNEKAQRWNLTGTVANPATTVNNPDPWIALPRGYFDNIQRTGQVEYTAETVGLYAQDILQLGPFWKFILGARWDYFKADYDRPAPLGPLARTDRVWSWRTGLLYQPSDEQSYYVAYGTSFNPSGELYALDDRGTNTPPEKNRNMEVGAKFELAQGNLSMRVAAYRSEKSNERNTDLAVSVEQNLLSGQRHTDGLELEFAGRITPNWEIFAGGARMWAEIDKATGSQQNTLGKVPINTPDYTLSLWTTYRFSSSWKFGGGVERVADRYANADNTNVVPAYTRIDLLLAYSRPSYELRLNVLNLSNVDYYEGVYQGHVIPGTKRSVQLSAEYKF